MTRTLGAILAAAIIFTSPSFAERIDQCGFIADPDGLGCRIFHPLTTGSDFYAIDIAPLPDSLLWTPIRLVGDVVSCQQPCDGYTSRYCVVNYTLSVCPSRDLGCGVLIRTGDVYEYCWHWLSPLYGYVNASPHGHAPGDTVRVFGVAGRCASTCDGDGCLWNESFTTCDGPDAVERTTWGLLKAVFR